MKILILENFFKNNNFESKLRHFYKILKLKSLIRKIKRLYIDTEIEVLSIGFENYYIDKNTDVNLLSEYRISINREKFLKIKNKIIEETKKNLFRFFKYHFNSKLFHLKDVLIPKIIDFSYTRYLITIFGEFELLKCFFEEKNFDKVILFNCNHVNFFKFFQILNNIIENNIEIYRDPILNKNGKLLNRFFSKYFIMLLGSSIKNLIFNTQNKKSSYYKREDLRKECKNIVFFAAHTENQYRSLKPIYDEIKRNKKYVSSFYRDKDYIPISKLTQLIRFIYGVNKLQVKSWGDINIEYNSLKLKKFFKTYYNSKIFFKYLLIIFNNLYYLNQFITNFKPSLGVIADEERVFGKLCFSNCYRKGIPTIYIPHAAIPFNPLDITKKEFKYAFVPGEKDREYFLNKGISENRIFVTGRPRYNRLYNGTINRLNDVKDIFNNKVYKFKEHKYTILFATNPVDFKTNKKLINSVLRSFQELNMIENLIIKLHPREKGLFHKALLEKMNVNPIIVRDVDILDLIKSCDLLISRRSTTILEAITLRTPAIVLDFVNTDLRFSDTLLFEREKSLLIVKSQDELIEKLIMLFNDKNSLKKYSEDLEILSKKYSPKTHVNPIKKTVKLISEIIEKE